MTPPNEESYYRYLAKIVIQLVSGPLKDHEQRDFYLASSSDLGDFAKTALEKKYPWSYIKKIVDAHIDGNMYCKCVSFAELQELFPCEVISDSGALEEICVKVLESQPAAVADYKKGKSAAMNRLKGMVMKETKGKADIAKVEEILISKMT